MKKIIAIFTAAAVMCGFVGCSGVSDSGSDKLSIVTTIYPAYDFARQVFGDTAEVTLLLKPGMESHSYDPSAKDALTIAECDLFICNGGESDQWVVNILEGAPDVKTLRMMDVVELHEEELVEGMQHEHDESCDHEHDESFDHEHEETEYDEHIWTSPENARKIVEAIADEACAISPENAAQYELSATEYISDIAELDHSFTELFENEQRYFVFGDRFPLLYFFEEYDLDYYAAFPGCGSNTEPSIKTITFLSEKLSGNDVIPAVFCIELSNRDIAQTLAGEAELPVLEFHACHNITADDFNAGETYVSLMQRNYDTLKNILS